MRTWWALRWSPSTHLCICMHIYTRDVCSGLCLGGKGLGSKAPQHTHCSSVLSEGCFVQAMNLCPVFGDEAHAGVFVCCVYDGFTSAHKSLLHVCSSCAPSISLYCPAGIAVAWHMCLRWPPYFPGPELGLWGPRHGSQHLGHC